MSLSVENTVKRILRPWALVTVAAASMAAPAIAADTAADNGLAEVVVTAQFRQQKLQDTPVAITAVKPRCWSRATRRVWLRRRRGPERDSA